eukprot:6040594-Prymnesium_polylepis.2
MRFRALFDSSSPRDAASASRSTSRRASSRRALASSSAFWSPSGWAASSIVASRQARVKCTVTSRPRPP